MNKNFIHSNELMSLIKDGKSLIIDIRNQSEYVSEHIENSLCCPLDCVSEVPSELKSRGDRIVFVCQTGVRTSASVDFLSAQGWGNFQVLEGGINAWKKNGGNVVTSNNNKIPVMRQVLAVAGFLVLLGVLLAIFVSDYFIVLSGFIGIGLMFSGISGYCGMAKLLMLLPYNKRA